MMLVRSERKSWRGPGRPIEVDRCSASRGLVAEGTRCDVCLSSLVSFECFRITNAGQEDADEAIGCVNMLDVITVAHLRPLREVLAGRRDRHSIKSITSRCLCVVPHSPSI